MDGDIGIATSPASNGVDKAMQVQIAKDNFGETEENREATLAKLKEILLAKNPKVLNLTKKNMHNSFLNS